MPKERLPLAELIRRKIDKAGGVTMKDRRRGKHTSPESRMADRRIFINNYGIPLERINSYAENDYMDVDDDIREEEPVEEPVLFQPSWIAPYSAVLVVIAGLEGTSDHIRLAQAAHVLTGSPTFHINYAAVPSHSKVGYQNKLRHYLRKIGKQLRSNGIMFAVTCKRGRSAEHDPVNIPKPLRYYASNLIVSDYANPSHTFYRFLKSRLFRPRMTAMFSTKDIQFVCDNVLEEARIKEFKFQTYK